MESSNAAMPTRGGSQGDEMTKQIHDGVRRNRRWVVALAAAGSLAAALIFLVIPAFGSPAGSGVPPANLQLGVVPTDVATGGQSNDCAVFNSPGSAQIRFANPKTGVTNYTIGGIAVSVSLTMNPPNANYPKTTDPGYDASKYPGSHNDGKWPAYGNDKYVSVTVTGAKLADIGVKGGTDTTRYNYVGQANSTGDTYLHGPAQSVVSASDPTPTQLYSVSNLTLCLRFGSASGTVYNDANPLPNGTYDSPPDTPLPGWTVRLYKGVTPGTAGGGSLVATTTSATDGTYSLSTSFDTGLWYRVCEAPPAGTWAQSQPLPNSVTLCTGAGEKAKGYDFKPAAATEQVGGKDLGRSRRAMPGTVQYDERHDQLHGSSGGCLQAEHLRPVVGVRCQHHHSIRQHLGRRSDEAQGRDGREDHVPVPGQRPERCRVALRRRVPVQSQRGRRHASVQPRPAQRECSGQQTSRSFPPMTG